MNYLFIDTETGGLDPKAHALLSMAVVAFRIHEGKLAPLEGEASFREFDVQIAPHPETDVRLSALRVQGISWAALDDPMRLDECEALTRFGEWLAQLPTATTYDWPIWAHNAEFDRNFVSAAIRRSTPRNTLLSPLCGRDSQWSCTRYEAQNLVSKRCMNRPEGNGPIKAGYSLDALCRHFGIDRSSRTAGHGALTDARLGARVLAKLLRVGGTL
jgi:DNA polymerase III epsilon subunit-like protein